MSALWIATMLQVVAAIGLLNVWLIRARSSTSYRGGKAQSLKEEFAEYGLPGWFFYVIGALKIGSAFLLIAGVWMPVLVLPAAGVLVALMLGALAMHVKVNDPLVKSLPAFVMLLVAVGIILLR